MVFPTGLPLTKRKVSAKPHSKPRAIIFLRGFVVYFWVDRRRRKFCYWEVSITFLFAVISFLEFCFYFCNPSLQWFLCKLKREVSKISFFILYLLFYYVLFFKRTHSFTGTFFNVAFFFHKIVALLCILAIISLLPWVVYLHQLQCLPFAARAFL